MLMYALNVYHYDKGWTQFYLYFVKLYYSSKLLHELFYTPILLHYMLTNMPMQIAVTLFIEKR